ncbi:hypothetical protein HHE02_08440 [Helicobacter heilmannii]|nr:hypothetical protein [Helicobacter heilmannii]CRF47553.1 hypothetical protein HHE02_08440 [Helicobacter heilmannii]CRF49097.1 hypothetical protein HHE03_06940 [Helicobacter heilmannii]
MERTKANGLEHTCLDAKELKELEPNITGPGKIFFPTSGEAF